MTEYHLGSGPYSNKGPGATEYFPICGHSDSDGTEVNQQVRIRFAASLRNLFVRIRFNLADGTTTIRSRVNGANGNLSVSIGASATGDFEDTTNSDTLSTADLINTQYVSAASMGNIGPHVVGYTLNNTDDNRGIVVVGTDADLPTSDLAGATTYYTQIFGQIEGFPISEFAEDYTFRHEPIFSQLRAYVETNEPTDASTVRLRINGANGNLNLSITGATTGEFEDTVNTDSISVGDEVGYQIVVGTGGHGGPILILTIIQMHHDAGETRISAAGETDPIELTTGIQWQPIEGTMNWSALGVILDYGFPARFPFDVRNYYLNIGINTYDVASVFTVREAVADVDTALTITVGASTTGRFEDTVNTVSVEVGDRLYNEWDSTGRTSGQANVSVIGMEISLQAAPLDNYAPMVVRRVEVLAY